MKKVVMLILFFTIVFLIPVLKTQATTIKHSGKSGDLNWSIDSNGQLTITGNGDYERNAGYWGDDPTWTDYSDEIKTVKINVSNITTCEEMFTSLTNVKAIDLNGLDTSQVTNMSEMFSGCTSLETLNLEGVNTSSVTDMSEMFSGCTSLEALNLEGVNTSSVTDMSEMFFECKVLKILDLSNFNTSKVTDMRGMFEYCSSLASLNIKNFNTVNVTDMRGMFEYCFDKDANVNLDLSNFNTSNVTKMSWMFDYCGAVAVNLSSFNTSKVTNVEHMFNKTNFTILDLSSFDLHSVKMEVSPSMYTGLMICAPCKLVEIKTPRNVVTEEQLSWYWDYVGNEEVKDYVDDRQWEDSTGKVYESLPKNLSYSITLTAKKKPKPASKNTTLTVFPQQCKVKVISSSETAPTVSYIKSTNSSAKTITIPDTVKVDGITYKVTSVASNALANNKKVTKVTVGKNVTSIGKNAFKKCIKLKTISLKSTSLKSIGSNAFYGDKNLKTITIKSSKLTSKSVGKNVFKGTNKKLTIKVPKKKVSSYKKFLKKKGNSKVTVKKG